MHKMLLNTVILLFLGVVSVHCDYQSHCYMEDVGPYEYFGTMTSYERVRAPGMVILQQDVCKPIYIWASIRHGARYSSDADLKKSSELQRLILSNHETDEHLQFQYAPKRRIKDSTVAFVEAMYGSSRASNINISSNQDTLRYLKLSEGCRREVGKNKGTLKEKELFLETKRMQSLIKEVSDPPIGFNESLSEKTIKHMYFACAFENACSPNSRPGFCAAFTREHLQVLEYFHSDLLDYYKFGYGSAYNVKMRSPVVEDLLLKLEMVTKSENVSQEAPKAHFNFTHSTTLTHVITKLGLFRDERPLLHSNYGWKRDWFVHTISPFSGNVIAVLHVCDEKPGLEKYRIALYHNEMLTHIPGCPTGLCPLSRFSGSVRLNNFGTSASTSDFGDNIFHI